MERDLKDKVVVVTGGAGGIGFEITDKYLQKGAKLAIILDINETVGAKAVEILRDKHGDRVVFFNCDVTRDLEEVSRKIIEKYEYIDILVNSAGVFDEISARRTMEIDATAVIEWSMKFYELMDIESGGKGGTIVNIASIFGFQVTPYSPFYHAAKFAVVGFTKSLGHEKRFKRSLVRVIAICPGVTTGTDLATNMRMTKWHDDMLKLTSTLPRQDVSAVGNAAVEVFNRAESGTAWVIEGARPIEQV